jgi:hypothetical protein
MEERMTRWKIRRAILAAVAVAALAQLAVTQENAVREARSSNAGSPPTTSPAPSGHPEGIQIHGHWTVTVRNPDGRVASRHEFDNSMTTNGKQFILGVLIGDTFPLRGYPPVWELKISGSLCRQGGPSTMGDCVLSVTGGRKVGGALEFSGTVKMDGAGQIMAVATQVGGPSAPGRITFSSRDLTQPDAATGQTPAPVNVQAGQNVDFTVDFSIS